MKRLFIALMLISSAAGATVIDRYATELDVHADGGSRAMVTLDLKNCQAGRFVLPVGFGGMDRLEVQAAPDGVVLKPVPGKESSTLEIELPPGIAASTACALRLPHRMSWVARRPLPEKRPRLLPIPSCCGTRSSIPARSRSASTNFQCNCRVI
jgi:hypothetical protein